MKPAVVVAIVLSSRSVSTDVGVCEHCNVISLSSRLCPRTSDLKPCDAQFAARSVRTLELRRHGVKSCRRDVARSYK
jgi:hypothetical protein